MLPLPSPMMNYVASELTITHSILTELPILMESSNKSGYGIVTNLTLNDNNLTAISLENLPPALNVLNVRNNHLETFNETVRTFLSNITSLKLSLGGNPWRCDCSNKGFVSFVQQQIRDNKIADPNDITCDNGDTPVNEVDVSKLCSESENLLIMILCIITAIMGLGIGGFAALYYKYQKQIKMWLYSHNLLLWFVTEEELDKVCCFCHSKNCRKKLESCHNTFKPFLNISINRGSLFPPRTNATTLLLAILIATMTSSLTTFCLNSRTARFHTNSVYTSVTGVRVSKLAVSSHSNSNDRLKY
jgi:hypothetical protein